MGMTTDTDGHRDALVRPLRPVAARGDGTGQGDETSTLTINDTAATRVALLRSIQPMNRLVCWRRSSLVANRWSSSSNRRPMSSNR
jgi:hypothetical protein